LLRRGECPASGDDRLRRGRRLRRRRVLHLPQFGADFLNHPSGPRDPLEFGLNALTIIREFVHDLDEPLLDNPPEPADEAQRHDDNQ